jgi:hypothetical protein
LGGDYNNLVYGCIRCNGAKGDREVPDPCRILLRDDLYLLDDGNLDAQTPEARRLVRKLGVERSGAARVSALVAEHPETGGAPRLGPLSQFDGVSQRPAAAVAPAPAGREHTPIGSGKVLARRQAERDVARELLTISTPCTISDP